MIDEVSWNLGLCILHQWGRGPTQVSRRSALTLPFEKQSPKVSPRPKIGEPGPHAFGEDECVVEHSGDSAPSQKNGLAPGTWGGEETVVADSVGKPLSYTRSAQGP